VYVVGGLTEKKGSVTRVDIYDPESGKWSQGVDLPGGSGSHVGFAPAVCVLNGRLYASGNNGKVLRLDEKQKKWEHVATQAVQRFVHRIVPGPRGQILVVGGSAREGDARAVEVITPAGKRTAGK